MQSTRPKDPSQWDKACLYPILQTALAGPAAL